MTRGRLHGLPGPAILPGSLVTLRLLEISTCNERKVTAIMRTDQSVPEWASFRDRSHSPASHAVRTKTLQQSEKILTVAARLFASHRFHETRMEDIAAAAEVGKGTLYRYFKDKDELYSALLIRAAEQLQVWIRERLEPAQDTRGKLEAIVDALITFFDDQPHLLDLIQHAEAMKRSDRIFAWQETREKNFRLVREILEAATANGEFGVDDPTFESLFLLCGLRAVLRFSKPPRPPDLARQIVEHFLHGHARPLVQPNGRSHPAPLSV